MMLEALNALVTHGRALQRRVGNVIKRIDLFLRLSVMRLPGSQPTIQYRAAVVTVGCQSMAMLCFKCSRKPP